MVSLKSSSILIYSSSFMYSFTSSNSYLHSLWPGWLSAAAYSHSHWPGWLSAAAAAASSISYLHGYWPGWLSAAAAAIADPAAMFALPRGNVYLILVLASRVTMLGSPRLPKWKRRLADDFDRSWLVRARCVSCLGVWRSQIAGV